MENNRHFEFWSFYVRGPNGEVAYVTTWPIEIDAVMKKRGHSPVWRRTEAAIARRLGIERSAIRMRYRLRGERPNF